MRFSSITVTLCTAAVQLRAHYFLQQDNQIQLSLCTLMYSADYRCRTVVSRVCTDSPASSWQTGVSTAPRECLITTAGSRETEKTAESRNTPLLSRFTVNTSALLLQLSAKKYTHTHTLTPDFSPTFSPLTAHAQTHWRCSCFYTGTRRWVQ